MKQAISLILSYILFRLTGIQTATAKREFEASRLRHERNERQWNDKCNEIQRLLDAEHLARFGWTAEKKREYAL